MANQRQTMITLIALAAAAVVAAVIAWMWFGTSSDTPPVPEDVTESVTEEVTPVPEGEVPVVTSDGAFNLNVLQRSGYKALDLRPIQNGQLPIKPPETTGKANPFL